MILQLNEIRLSFTNDRKKTFHLLRCVNLNVEPGKVTALVGGNGTGKTTLFNIICGFQQGWHGKVIFNGHNISHLAPYSISRMGIGRLFQNGQLIEGLSLMDNLKMGVNDTNSEIPFASLLRPHIWKKSEVFKEQQALETLNRLFGKGNKYLGMTEKDASTFSYGEQRLLSLARLLMGNCKLLLLDEPTSGVNPVYIETIASIINNMKAQGITILLIEHNMHFVKEIADTCAYLDDGCITKVGSTEDVLNDQEVRNSYLGI